MFQRDHRAIQWSDLWIGLSSTKFPGFLWAKNLVQHQPSAKAAVSDSTLKKFWICIL